MADAPASSEHALLAERLFERTLLRGRFELRSGAVSDRYFDKYRATTDPTLLRMLGRSLAELTRDRAAGAACIVAPELGAVPLAAVLALELELPYLIVRGVDKTYGTAKRIEGAVVRGACGVLVEDVVTSGGAALEALAAARDAGIVVERAICVLDRNGGGREALAAVGVSLHSLLDRADLDAAYDAGLGEHRK